jgi:cell wall-associated NlpC family hydrolase
VIVAGATIGQSTPVAANQLSQERAEAAQIAAQIQAQGTQLAVLSERYDEDQIRVQQLDQQLSQTRAQIATTRTQMGRDRSQLRQLAIHDYTSGGASSGIEGLFAPSGESAVATNEYQQVASGNMSGSIDQLNAAQSTLNAEQSQLQSTQSQARATLASAQSAQQSAQSTLAAQQSTLSHLTGSIATLVAQQQAAQARAQAAAFAARVAASNHAASNAASGRSGSGGRPGSGSHPVTTLVSAPTAPGGATAVAAAESQIGVPYRWAGATPGVGFDCSGLTMWAWGRAGVSLSHSAAAQYGETTHVPLSDLQPGDLLFYREGGTIGHVTMYVGPGQMVQAIETGTQIQITGIWTSGLVGAGRP